MAEAKKKNPIHGALGLDDGDSLTITDANTRAHCSSSPGCQRAS